MTEKPTILHISADYRDRLNPKKTTAINSLIDGTPQFHHALYSLHRVDGWRGIESFPLEGGVSAGKDDRVAIIYKALPKGILWGARLDELADWMISDLAARGIKPDAIEAHKFTVEGVIGLKVARHFNVPLTCDIQGNSDCNILRRKKSLRPIYKDIAKYTSLVFAYAPWSATPFVNAVNLSRDKCVNLPVMPLHDFMSAAPVSKTDNLVTVFNLDAWKSKNLQGMTEGIAHLLKARAGATLDVIGAGAPQTILDIRAMINGLGMEGRVRLCGAVPNIDLPARLKTYAGFVLPSLAESYGLVYAESLLSGVPILFSRDRGIDGYFDAEKIGYACTPTDSADIARGMAHILDNQKPLKASIGALQNAGALDVIRKDTIMQTYVDGITRVLNGGV